MPRMPNMKKFAEKDAVALTKLISADLNSYREFVCLSQADVAKKMGVTPAFVAQIEGGEKLRGAKTLRLQTIAKIAKAQGFDSALEYLAYLYGTK